MSSFLVIKYNMLLSNLRLNEKAIITDINCNSTLVKRLNDLGVCKGKTITLVRVSPLKDPIEFYANGTYFAIRMKDCEKIEVKLCR